MTMFQILTQKGWIDIMHSTMTQSRKFYPLVAVYFILYHLFVTLVCQKEVLIDVVLFDVVCIAIIHLCCS